MLLKQLPSRVNGKKTLGDLALSALTAVSSRFRRGSYCTSPKAATLCGNFG